MDLLKLTPVMKYDGGSGSLLITCETTNRICYMNNIEGIKKIRVDRIY